MKRKCSTVSGRIYPKAMLSMSKNVFIKDTFCFRKTIPIADSETVLKLHFPLPSFSSPLFPVISHTGKQITVVKSRCEPLTSAKAGASPGELLAQSTSLLHPVERKM